MSPDTNSIFLFANGPLSMGNSLRTHIERADVLIAVDGGLAHLVNLGLAPDLIIGDLDSADPQQVQHFRDQNVPVRKFPSEKDATDLELAIEAALEMEPEKICILAALGGRIDQTLGNIFLLTQPKLAGIDIRLMDATQELFIIRDSAQVHGQAGQRVSLLPLYGPVMGIRTAGLKYPLADETLYIDQTRGISNEMNEATAHVKVKHGTLLCIHEFSTPSP